MALTRHWVCVVMLSVASSISCSSDSNGDDGGDGGGDGGGDTSKTCTSSDPGVDWAPCKKDSDCYTAYCKLDGNPGPYCFTASHDVIASGSGYTCEEDSECEEIAADFVARGGRATCHHDSIRDTCTFSCPQ
jgi:hypothetical protein